MNSPKNCSRFLEILIEKGYNIFERYENEVQEDLDAFDTKALAIKERLEQQQKIRKENKGSLQKGKRNKKNGVVDSSQITEQENGTTQENVSKISLSTSKPRRKASHIASLMINRQQHIPLKLRRPEESNDLFTHHKNIITQEVTVKTEKNDALLLILPDNATELMPPPHPAKTRRGRTRKIKSEIESSDTETEQPSIRSTRSKAQKNKNKNPSPIPVQSSRIRKKKTDSDIMILPDAPVPRITISDSDNEKEKSEGEYGQSKEVEAKKKIEHTNEKSDTDMIIKPVEVLQRRISINKEIPKEKEMETEMSTQPKLDLQCEPKLVCDTTTSEENQEAINMVKKNEMKHKSQTQQQKNADTTSLTFNMSANDKENGKNKHDTNKKHPREWNSEDEASQRSNKRTKKLNKANEKNNKKETALIREKIPLISLENIKMEKDASLYEDALSNSGLLTNQTYDVQDIASPTLNATVTIAKATNFNATYNQELTPNQTVMLNKPDTSKINPSESELDLLNKHGVIECSVLIEKNTEMKEVYRSESNKLENINCTVTIEKMSSPSKIPTIKSPTWKKPAQKIVDENDSLLTEDESDNVIDDFSSFKKSSVKANKKCKTKAQANRITSSSQSSEKETPKNQKNKRGIKSKPMFSPYAESPVKKRVAAFEKLQQEQQTTRVTRTKTRKLIENKENQERTDSAQRTIKAPTKFITPMLGHKLKSVVPHTDTKVARIGLISSKNNIQNVSTMSSSSDSLLRSQSAVKLTRKELQERREEDQKRKMEKEEEIKKKKEVMLQAKIEEQKRIREEKMLRVKEAREEKERLKEEKLRQQLIEKEEKIKEEQEKKKAYLAQKAAEIEEQRKIVEKNRLAKQREEMLRQKEEEEQKRLKLKQQEDTKIKKYKPPPLPTEDNSDSDSEDGNSVRKKVPPPEWAQRNRLYPVLSAMNHIPNCILTNFYNSQPTTPDLTQIFEYIPKHYIKRNSSAVWRTPPRYSQLPKF